MAGRRAWQGDRIRRIMVGRNGRQAASGSSKCIHIGDLPGRSWRMVDALIKEP